MLARGIVIVAVAILLVSGAAHAQQVPNNAPMQEEQNFLNHATALEVSWDHLKDAMAGFLQQERAERAALIDANTKIDWLWKNFGEPAYKDSER